jgi:uroporphyrinogen decarboxylase
MNSRERFHAVMHYEPRDRSPIMDFGFWRDTLTVWEKYGFPKQVDTDEFFGMDPQWIGCGVNARLCPEFPEEVYEDKGETEIVRQADGVVVERGKFLGSIPRHLQHTLCDRDTWEMLYKPRLRPESPDRLPKDFNGKVAEWTRENRDYPLFLNVGSLYGVPRNWLGLERVSELVYDDPALFEEMVDTLAEISVAVIEQVCGAGVRPEAAHFWEDMCYKSGPLLSPKMFKDILVPRYKRITETLLKYGVDIVFVDSDGKIDALAPLWLEGGVNTMFPLEVGTWKADPYSFRERFGKEMRIMGGFDKRILADSRVSITREIERLAPLVEEGGFIPMPDHRVPADVPFDHYLFYIEEVKRIWGKGLKNLIPTGMK